MKYSLIKSFFFIFNDTPTSEISPLSQPDALPFSDRIRGHAARGQRDVRPAGDRPNPPGAQRDGADRGGRPQGRHRSEEHTSELQSQSNLVCRLLLEKKNKDTDHADAMAARDLVFL